MNKHMFYMYLIVNMYVCMYVCMYVYVDILYHV